MNKYLSLAIALYMGLMTGFAPSAAAEDTTPAEAVEDVSYLLKPYSDSIPEEWLVFKGSPRSVYFKRVIDASKVRDDEGGVTYLEQLAAAPPAVPPDLTPEMSRFYPDYAASYNALQEREKNAMAYKSHAPEDQWRVDQTEADLSVVAWELWKGKRASTSFMRIYLNDAAWALNHHIEVTPRVATEAPAPAPAQIKLPTAELNLSINSIERGQCANLTWRTANATQYTLNGDAVPPNGNRQVCPGQNENYQLIAVGPGGRAEDQASLEVTLPPLATYRINFDFNEEAIRADAVDTMRQVAALLRDQPDLHMSLNGHTDAKGSSEYNLALGQRRATSVRDYFLAHFGLNPSSFNLKSMGEDRPIAANKMASGEDNPEGRALNRRAEFIEIR